MEQVEAGGGGAFKELTPGNWKEPDSLSTRFWRESRVVERPVDMRGDDWARAFLAVDLKEHVPNAIRELFEIARGALLYGWFFYPLFRLGEEQLYRVVEASVVGCYRDLGGPRRHPTFKESVNWLIECGVISADDEPRWDAARHLRNLASHPARAAVMPPGAVLRMLTASAHDINRLFARKARLELAGE